jgi:hypothetical protein
MEQKSQQSQQSQQIAEREQQQRQQQQQQQQQQLEEDEESLAEEDQNVFDESETACTDPNNQFCKSLLEFKHRLYSQTVLRPESVKPDSQQINLLNPYLNLLEYFRGILVPILGGVQRQIPPLSQKFLERLPSDSRQSAIELHTHIADTARQNRTSNRELLAAYTTFIDDMFHNFPFLMNNEFS